VAFIARNRDRPFFLHHAPHAVHTPIEARPDLVEPYAGKAGGGGRNARYAALLHGVDEAVGAIVAALDEHGLRERTLVLFTSDNGGLLGPTDNAPLRSGKGFPYEGGIRVPLIASWPGTIPAGAVSSAPVTSVDLLPTILAAAAVEREPGAPELDGVSRS
jgi:arylsulfatase A-like enzyme